MKKSFVLIFIAAFLHSTANASQPTDLVVKDYWNPGFSLADLKSMNSSCIDEMLSWWEKSSCNLTSRYGHGTTANTFACIKWEEDQARPPLEFKSYETEAWDAFPFTLPGDEVFCRDERQIVFKMNMWPTK
jgi:hypothetical protein